MPDQPRPVESTYIAWLKSLAPVTYNLAFSGVPTCPRAMLAGELDELVTHEHGWRPLLERIASRYGVSPEGVVLAQGTTGANFVVFSALLAPGDHVVVEHPAYDPLHLVPRFLGATVSFFERRHDDGYRVHVAAIARAMTPRTRLIVVSNLHNPTGAVMTEAELRSLAKLAEEADAYVLVDEVYLEWLIGHGARAAAAISPRLISTSSLTKAYGLGALRAGWVLAEPALAMRLRSAMTLFDNNMSNPTEQLMARAFDRLLLLIDPLRDQVARARAMVAQWVERTESLSWVEPAGGTVAFVHVRGRDVDRLAERLRTEYDTLVVPGSFFGASEHIRVGLGMDPDHLTEGLNRISAALREG